MAPPPCFAAPGALPLGRAPARGCARRARAAPTARAARAPVTRRAALRGAAALAAALAGGARGARAAEGLRVETPDFGYTVPAQGVSRNVASLSGGRVVTVFVDDEDGDTNVSMVQTPVQGDFRKLTSFGTLDNVLGNIVPAGVPGNKVLSVEEVPRNNAYVIEYLIKPSGELPLRHLITVFSLQPGTSLCTLTAQAKEENWPAKEAMLKRVVASYTLKDRGF